MAPALRAALANGGVLLLAGYAYGAHARNEVWHSEETLWRDVTEKSPRNGRGWMNYGLVLMGRGDYQDALRYFQQALIYTPNYSLLHVNLGVAYGGTGNDAEAESHFRLAQSLAPDDAQSYYYYARWLKAKGRVPEAAAQLETGIGKSPAYLDARYLLMRIYEDRNDALRLKPLAEQTLALFPNDRTSSDYLAWANDPIRQHPAAPAASRVAESVQDVERAVRQSSTPENYLNLSLAYERAGRHEDCIAAAREALKIKPDYAEAYNNIAAADQSLQRWDDAIQAAQQALKLKPDFQLARNNLQYAVQQKERTQKQ